MIDNRGFRPLIGVAFLIDSKVEDILKSNTISVPLSGLSFLILQVNYV